MTRTVHPYPLAKNGSGASAPPAAKAFPSHPYEAMVVEQLQRNSSASHPVHTAAAPRAMPISVTTASHPDPGMSSSHLHNLQLATGVPQKQLHAPAVKVNFASVALAGPKGGFTLPCTAPIETPIPPPPSPVEMKKSASAIPLMQGYSAASIASIHAQDVKTPNALGRRSHSAPNTVILSKNSNKSKYKYRKVVGGKAPASAIKVSHWSFPW